MSKSRPITKKELKAIKASVAAARNSFIPAHLGFFDICGPTGAALLDKRLLLRAYRWYFGRTMFRLNQPFVRALLLEASDSEDKTFFIRLGKVLSQKPVEFSGNRGFNELKWFLVSHWAESKDGLPELFYLIPDALAQLCRHKFRQNSLSTEVVAKTRQRLGLKTFRRQKLKAIVCGGKWTFPPVDKS